MNSDASIDAAIDQETEHIKTNVANNTAAVLELQLLVGKNAARFVAQESLARVSAFPDQMPIRDRYQVLLAHLYAWSKYAR